MKGGLLWRGYYIMVIESCGYVSWKLRYNYIDWYSPILMTGGNDIAVVIETTIMTNNSAIVSDVKAVCT